MLSRLQAGKFGALVTMVHIGAQESKNKGETATAGEGETNDTPDLCPSDIIIKLSV